MRCRLRENISDIEKMVRFYIAIFLMTLSVSTQNYVYLIITIILLYTALKKRCFIYGIFGLNKNISKTQYYEELLLKNNINKICIYENDGQIVYKNNKFLKQYEDLYNIKELDKKNINVKYQYLEDEELNICYIED